MALFSDVGLFWQDMPASRKRGERELGPMPEIPETGWRPTSELPNIRDAKWIAFDTETYDPELDDYGPGWARKRGHMVGASLAWSGGKIYLPFRHEVQKEMNLDPDMCIRYLSWALGGTCPKIGANLYYDVGWCREEDIIVNGPLYDVQFAEALLMETSKLALDELGFKYLHRGKTTEVLKEWALSYYRAPVTKWRRDIYRCPPTLVGPYAEDDAEMPYEILMKQWPKLVHHGLMPLFEMECGLINLLVEMRFKGITIDLDHANRLHKLFGDKAAEIQKEIDYEAGMEVNTNAADSLAQAFDKLGLGYGRTAPTANKPEGNPSFTKDFLKAQTHPFGKKIIRLREANKLKSTFIEGYLLNSHVNKKVYCTFHPMSTERGGARTGRFASSDPNLQNIPVRSDDGKLIRAAFIMDEGHECIRDFDYSQIEYRMLAHFATGEGSAEIRAAYNRDPDIDFHNMAGELVKNITGIELARSYVKNINFGIIYGVGIDHLAEMLGVPLARAKEIVKQYHTALPFAKQTMKDITTEVNRTGIIKTLMGRMSHFDLWEPDDWNTRNAVPLPYKDALARYGSNIIRAYTFRATNYKLQGSAADMMKKAMYECYIRGVFNVTGVPRLTVHDELVFSDPGGIPEDAWKEIQHIAETCLPVKIPIKFEGSKGANWGEAH